MKRQRGFILLATICALNCVPRSTEDARRVHPQLAFVTPARHGLQQPSPPSAREATGRVDACKLLTASEVATALSLSNVTVGARPEWAPPGARAGSWCGFGRTGKMPDVVLSLEDIGTKPGGPAATRDKDLTGAEGMKAEKVSVAGHPALWIDDVGSLWAYKGRWRLTVTTNKRAAVALAEKALARLSE
jgi:hypothetical protein